MQVGTAAPRIVALVQQGEREETLSAYYGGQGSDSAGANPLYEAIGDVRRVLPASPLFFTEPLVLDQVRIEAVDGQLHRTNERNSKRAALGMIKAVW